MTRKQRIQAAKAFTEREGGLEILAEVFNLHLEEGYLIASAVGLSEKKLAHYAPTCSHKKSIVWAFNSGGIATTEF